MSEVRKLDDGRWVIVSHEEDDDPQLWAYSSDEWQPVRPRYEVWAPWGGLTYSGPLDAEDVKRNEELGYIVHRLDAPVVAPEDKPRTWLQRMAEIARRLR